MRTDCVGRILVQPAEVSDILQNIFLEIANYFRYFFR